MFGQTVCQENGYGWEIVVPFCSKSKALSLLIFRFFFLAGNQSVRSVGSGSGLPDLYFGQLPRTNPTFQVKNHNPKPTQSDLEFRPKKHKQKEESTQSAV